MLKIDQKNKRILTVLDEDARTSLSKIASAAGLSKQLADYRIRKMLKDGVIEGFTINCDLTKLGYSTFAAYLRLKNLTDQKEQEIISILIGHPFVKWAVSCQGKWDVAFAISAKNIVDFNSKLEEIIEKIRNNVETYDTNIILSLQNFCFHMIEKESICEVKQPRKEFATDNDIERLDALDVSILQELEKNSRSGFVNIGVGLKASGDVVRYRIRNLVARKIITSFKPRISFKTIGYNWYQVIISLRAFPEAEEKKFLEKLKQIPHISYIVRCMGKWDFEIHVHAESNEEFRKILMKIRDALAGYIISYDTIIMFKKLKSTTLPRGVADELIRKFK